MNETRIEHGCDLGLDFGLLVVRVAIRADVDGGRIGKEVNVVLDGSRWW